MPTHLMVHMVDYLSANSFDRPSSASTAPPLAFVGLLRLSKSALNQPAKVKSPPYNTESNNVSISQAHVANLRKGCVEAVLRLCYGQVEITTIRHRTTNPMLSCHHV